MPLLLRSEEIKLIFFDGGKFHGMLFQLFSYLHYAVKYMWARLYRKKRTFWIKQSVISDVLHSFLPPRTPKSLIISILLVSN